MAGLLIADLPGWFCETLIGSSATGCELWAGIAFKRNPYPHYLPTVAGITNSIKKETPQW
jgi:hypothetical protein